MKRTKKYKAAIICAALKNSDQFQDYLEGWIGPSSYGIIKAVTIDDIAECAEAWLEENDTDVLEALDDMP